MRTYKLGAQSTSETNLDHVSRASAAAEILGVRVGRSAGTRLERNRRLLCTPLHFAEHGQDGRRRRGRRRRCGGKSGLRPLNALRRAQSSREVSFSVTGVILP